MRKLATIAAISAVAVGGGLAVASTVSAGSTNETFGTITKMTTSFSSPDEPVDPRPRGARAEPERARALLGRRPDHRRRQRLDPDRSRRQARLRARQHDPGQRSHPELLTSRAGVLVTPALVVVDPSGCQPCRIESSDVDCFVG